MASAAKNLVGKVAIPMSKGGSGKTLAEGTNSPSRNQMLQKEARRNPELYVCPFSRTIDRFSLTKLSDSPWCHEYSIRSGWLALWYVVKRLPRRCTAANSHVHAKAANPHPRRQKPP